MRAKGFEKTRECGRRRNEVRELLREFLRVAWPEAFCIIPLPTLSVLGRGKGEDMTYLSIIVIKGATK